MKGNIDTVPICLIATICFVSLCMALYTVPKEPVPSFSRSVYCDAGLLCGIGYGSLGLRASGEKEGDFVILGWREEEERSEVARFLSLEPGMTLIKKAGDPSCAAGTAHRTRGRRDTGVRRESERRGGDTLPVDVHDGNPRAPEHTRGRRRHSSSQANRISAITERPSGAVVHRAPTGQTPPTNKEQSLTRNHRATQRRSLCTLHSQIRTRPNERCRCQTSVSLERAVSFDDRSSMIVGQ
jgi:hypothetical protein